MRLDRIYTKVGDKGTSRLASGELVSKASCRLAAYGEVDELNSCLGLWRDHITEAQKKKPELQALAAILMPIQHELFDIGAELATSPKALRTDSPYLVNQQAIARLEAEMDELNSKLAPLANFVLPGGHPLNSFGHLCRCVCRRCERAVIRLHEEETLRAEPRIYLNRLSDWLFIVSRSLSQLLDSPETLWQQKISPPT